MADGAPYGTLGNRSLDPRGCPKTQSGSGVQASHLQYILELAGSILKGDADLGKDEIDAHKLLVEFYWLLHQIPEYLIRTNSEGCAESVSFTGPQLVGLRELWELMGGLNSAGTQTLVRRMAIQLGELERSGYVSLDQVWNIPTIEAQKTAMDLAITKVQRDLRATSGL
jgi:hypothetical protein